MGASVCDTCAQFARRLRTVLGEKGMTQRQLAAASGISEAGISRYASGSRTPNLHNLVLIRDSLGCEWKEILG